MANWSPEAQIELASYLGQVEALAGSRTTDVPGAVARVRERIENAAAAAGDQEQDVQALRRILSVVGAPEQAVSAAVATPPPTPGVQQTVHIQPAPAKRSGIPGCVWGIIGVGCLVMLLFVGSIMAAILLPALARAREAARRASCANNLKQVGLICKMFANEHDGATPPLDTELGKWMFDAGPVYPEYLTDTAILVCPSDTSVPADMPIDDHSYFYLAHVVQSEQEMPSYVAAVKAAIDADESLDGDLTAPDGTVFPRIMDNSGVSPIQASSIVVAFDRLGNHVPGGGNVLFMDGHVEFLRIGTFPMTQAVIDALESVEW